MRDSGATVTGAIIAVVVGCLVVLNMFGGVVSGIWLAVKGEWHLLLTGFALSFAMPLVWTIVTWPAIGLGTVLFRDHKNPSRTTIATGGFIIAAWHAAILGAWTLGVFLYFTNHTTEGMLIPLILWGYSTTMAPLSYMAHKAPPDSNATTLGLLFTVLAYGLLVILYLVGVGMRTMIICVASLFAAQSIIGAFLAVATAPRRSPKYYVEDGSDFC